MPAAERAFSERPPPRLYLDTDVILSHLVATREHHRRCTDFLVRLAESGNTTLYLSSLSWLEYSHVVMRQDFRERLSSELQNQFPPNRWQDPSERQRYLQHFVGAFEALLAQFDLVEVPLIPEIRLAAQQYMARYSLRAQDAVHVATAMHTGVPDLVSLDADFRRVDGLNLWNDLIHGRRR